MITANKRKLEAELNRDSVAEFEQLEQEVNKTMQKPNGRVSPKNENRNPTVPESGLNNQA